VATLLYKWKGPFCIKDILGHGSYMLQRWNHDNIPLQNYHVSCMYFLPLCLQPVELFDTPDLQYLNSSHGVAVHPLQPALNIKLFIDQWFNGQLPMEAPTYEPTSIAL
jgi:hypothetical protein